MYNTLIVCCRGCGAHLMMMPLSTEKLSVGNPAMFHSRILTGSPSVALRENSLERGIPILLHCSHHSLIWSCVRKQQQEQAQPS